MKKWTAFLCAAALVLSLAACGNGAGNGGAPVTTTDAVSDTTAAQNDALTLRLVDGAGTGMFTLAGAESGDVFTASADELTVYLDGAAASPADLRNGMTLTVQPGYELLETWPAQFAGATVNAESAAGDGYGDLCGLYLTVLEDLWTDDAALNEDVTYISVDLSDAPGALTDGERAAAAWLFAGRHGAQALTFSFEGLKENGFVNESELYWPDGVLFSIRATENKKQSEKKIVFDAEKWRSGTGAVFFTGCTAKRGKGAAWDSYQPGGYAVS